MYLALGDKERAIDEMERAYRERDANVAQIRTDPMLDDLRGNPRFEALVNQIVPGQCEIKASEVYLLTGEPGHSVNAELADYAAKLVTIKGKQTSRDGFAQLQVEEIRKF